MGAYFQYQVVTKEDGEPNANTIVFQSSRAKFLESHYVFNESTKNIIRHLSQATSEDSTAKVYCVCDYDSSENNEHCQKYLRKGERLTELTTTAITEDGDVVPNAIYLPSSSGYINNMFLSNTPMVHGFDKGFIVNKDKGEYIDVDKINDISHALQSKNDPHLISPLSLLTRKSKWNMGSGDIYFDDLFIDDIEEMFARWYGDNLYWSEKQPDNLQDITSDSLFVESFYDVMLENGGEIEEHTGRSVFPLNSSHSPFDLSLLCK